MYFTEYKKILSEHPKLSTVLPNEFDQLYKNGTRFDALVSYSSVEHSGLGRYGDKLNPWGDLITMAKAWCIMKPKARAFIGIPSVKDYLDVSQVPILNINFQITRFLICFCSTIETDDMESKLCQTC